MKLFYRFVLFQDLKRTIERVEQGEQGEELGSKYVQSFLFTRRGVPNSILVPRRE